MHTVIGNAIIALAHQAGQARAPYDAMNYAQAALNLANTYATMAYATIAENKQQVDNAAANRLVPAKEKRE